MKTKKRLLAFLTTAVGLCSAIGTHATTADNVTTPVLPQNGKYYFIVSQNTVYPSTVVEAKTVYIDPANTSRLSNHDYNADSPTLQDIFLVNSPSEGVYTMQHFQTSRYAGSATDPNGHSTTPTNLYLSPGELTINGTEVAGFYISTSDPSVAGCVVWNTYSGSFNWIDRNGTVGWKSLYQFVEAPASMTNQLYASDGIDSLKRCHDRISAIYSNMQNATYDDAAFTDELRLALKNKLAEASEALKSTPSADNAYYYALAQSLETQYNLNPWVDGGKEYWDITIDSIADGKKIMIESGVTGYRNKYITAYPAKNDFNSALIDDEGKSESAIWQLEATGATDAVYTDKPTYYLKDVTSGKYLGATSTTSTDINQRRMVDGTDNAYGFCFLSAAEINAKESKNINTYGNVNAVFIHHSNADGTWLRLSRFGGYTYLFYISTTSYSYINDWQAWTLCSGDKDYNISGELEQAIASTSDLSFDNIGTDPGYYPEEAVKPFAEALTQAKALGANNSRKQYRQAIDQLNETYTAASTASVNPVTDGYYYIKSAKTDYLGKDIVAYDKCDGTDRLSYHTLNPSSLKDIFIIKKIDDNKYSVQNLESKKYVERQQDANYISLSDKQPTDYWQQFIYKENTCFQWKDNSSSYTYYTNVNNSIGRYYSQGAPGSFDRWQLNRVPDSVIDELVYSIKFTLTDHSLIAEGDNISLRSIATALAANDNVTSLDLSAATLSDELTSEQLSSALTGNQLVFLPSASTLSGTNLIKNGICDQLVLKDKADFSPAKEFTATTASYHKTGLDGIGWYSAIMPYDITVPDGMTVLNNATVNSDNISLSQVPSGNTIAANTPFLYRTASGDVEFSAADAHITDQPQPSGALQGTYKLIPAGEATGRLILNGDGSAFATATAKASIPAFRAFINTTTASRRFTITINKELTGIVENGIVSDDLRPIDVYTVNGQLLRSQADPVTALQGLPKGIYIVNGKKISK